MKTELNKIQNHATELKFNCTLEDEHTLKVNLGNSITLVFSNHEKDDSLVKFENFGWHSHDTIDFTDGELFIELSYLEFLDGLNSGEILVVDEIKGGKVEDRYPIHIKFNEFFEDFKGNIDYLIRKIDKL